MSASIFISHAGQDLKVANTLCKALESRSFKCWISGRDILPGENFQVAIVRAIRGARIMLLVFTGNSNNSEEMTKELALASQHRLIVIPLRIEDVTPNEAFSYEFATRQWIDFFADWEAAMDQLSLRISSALGAEQAAAAAAAAAAEPTTPTLAPVAAAPVAAEPVKAEPVKAEVAKVEPPKPEPPKPEPAKVEPVPAVAAAATVAATAAPAVTAPAAAPAAKAPGPAPTAKAPPPSVPPKSGTPTAPAAKAPATPAKPAASGDAKKSSPLPLFVGLGVVVAALAAGAYLMLPSIVGHKPAAPAKPAIVATKPAPPAANVAAAPAIFPAPPTAAAPGPEAASNALASPLTNSVAPTAHVVRKHPPKAHAAQAGGGEVPF